MRLIVAFATLAIVGLPAVANAQLYRLTVAGHVTSVSPSVASNFTIGEAASATVIFDASSSGYQFYPNDPTIWYYSDAPKSGYLQLPTYLAQFTDASRIFVTNNGGGTIDRFIIEDTDPSGASVGGLSINNFFINFQGGTSTLNSTSLSAVPSRLAAFGSVTAALDFGTSNDGANRVQFIFDAVTLSAVPEPSAWAMMIVGMGAVGFAMRRRNVTTRVSYAA